MDAYDKPNRIFDFAYWPEFEGDIATLASLADNEVWKPKNITPVPPQEKENYYYKFSKDNPTLASYILNTYKRIVQEDILPITVNKQNARFHTGLFSPSREPIYALFEKNDYLKAQYWKFMRFCLKNDKKLLSLGPLPNMRDYNKSPFDLRFDPNKEIVPNIQHVLYEHPWRYPSSFQGLYKVGRENLLDGAIRRAQGKIRETPSSAVPQYYNGIIQWLLPLELMDEKVEVALVVDILSDCTYRGNTVLPLDWAYMNARVITKPQVNWLKV